MIWTDLDGLSWEIIDCWRPDFDGPRKRLPLSSAKAEFRAFVPHEREGPTMIFGFGRIAYRDTEDRTLRDQLRFAKQSTASAAERSWGKGS